MTIAFYPAFQRIEKQYEHIKAYGGSFVYDTGYLYLFGVLEEPFAVDFLILSVGIILAVSGAVAMEYQNGSIILLCATRAGKRKILARKILICGMAAAVLALVPFLCRIFRIASVYPMHSLSASVLNIPRYTELAVSFPIILFVLLFALSQIVSAILVALITTVLSLWRKNQVQAVFFALLFLAVPLILNLLGFEAAKWFSLYPLYRGNEVISFLLNNIQIKEL